MGKKDDKTNVMRILDGKGIKYDHFKYTGDPSLTGAQIAKKLGEDPKYVFKTLVTVSKSREYYVFMIPVEKELDLKKCAKAAGEKRVEMIHQKELLPLTGYVHGGCSPVGMKKKFKTFIDACALGFDCIYFSAGKIGRQVKLRREDFDKAVGASYADLTKD